MTLPFIWHRQKSKIHHCSMPQYAINLFTEMLNNSKVRPQLLTYPSIFKVYARDGLVKMELNFIGEYNH